MSRQAVPIKNLTRNVDMTKKSLHGPARVLLAAALIAASGLSSAQDKSVAVEAVPAFPAFNLWVTTSVVSVAAPAPVAAVQVVQVSAPAASVIGTDYQPLPVILGLPELPLVGAGAARAAGGWSPELNQQGVFMRQLVLDARGAHRELRSMAYKPKAGERFKIRVSATFDAMVDVDLVSGEAWDLRRVGPFYPDKGSSVQLRQGETVDLPLGDHEYFVMSRPADERLVVSARHVKAVGGARSGQPAYRQDGKQGSSYLQLVPRGTFPAVEQLASQAR